MSPSRAPEQRAWTVRPTAAGLGAVVVTALVVATSSSAQDPVLAGIVWVSLAVITAIGWVWPVLAAAGLRAEIVDSPTDGRVGRPATARLRITSRLPLPSVDVTLGGGEVERVAPRPDPEPATVPTTRRGVVRAIEAEVTVDGPLGLVRTHRRLRLDLPRPLHIGPDPAEVSWRREAGIDRHEDQIGAGAGAGSDVVRSVRPYRSGDPAHLVHWPSSARAGELIVRELEPPQREALVVVVHLVERSEAAEQAVSRAAGIVLDALRDGVAVVLCTSDGARPIVAEVTSPLHLNRRLAAADVGDPGRPTGAASRWPMTVCS